MTRSLRCARLKAPGSGCWSSATASTTHRRSPPPAGIEIGDAGSDLALQTADAVVVRDELATIPAVMALSRRARRLVTANLVIAASFITVLVAWNLLGDLPLPLGVAGHEGSTIIVGLNGLRLLHEAAWPGARIRSKARGGSRASPAGALTSSGRCCRRHTLAGQLTKPDGVQPASGRRTGDDRLRATRRRTPGRARHRGAPLMVSSGIR